MINEADKQNNESRETRSQATELDITKTNDRQKLLDNILAVFNEAISFEVIAKQDSYRAVTLPDVAGEEIFTTLSDKFFSLKELMVNCDGKTKDDVFITDEVIKKIQSNYNDLVLLRNFIRDTYINFTPLKKKTVKLERRGEEALPAVKTKAMQRVKDSVPQVRYVKESAGINPQTIIVTKEDLVKLFNEIKETFSFVKSTRTRSLSLFSKDKRSPEIRVLLGEFDEISRKIEQALRFIKQAVELNECNRVNVNFYKNLNREIIDNTKYLEKVLLEKQRSLPKNEKNKEDDKGEVGSPGDNKLPKTDESERVGMVGQSTGVKKEGGQNKVLPTEIDACQLWQKVDQNQFYNRSERELTKELVEGFYRGLAEGLSATELKRRFNSLKTQVDKMQDRPDIDMIALRANRILTLMQDGLMKGSEHLETAKILKQNMDRLIAAPEKKYPQVLKLYQELKELALNTEKEWLTVYGVHIPVGGPSGVTDVKKMLVVLEKERAKYFVNHGDPEHLVLVDEMIRLLKRSGEQGLTDDEVVRLCILARTIDVPVLPTEITATSKGVEFEKGITPDESQKGQDLETKSVEQAEQDKDDVHELVSPDLNEGGGGLRSYLKHKTMDIQPESNDEGRLDIAISKKTEPTLQNLPVRQPAPGTDGENKQTKVLPKPVHHKVVAQVERCDPINKAIPGLHPKVRPALEIFKKRSLVDEYLMRNDRYKSFIMDNFSSPADFENVLDSNITKLESETVDSLEKWLGETYFSAFLFLQDKTVEEVIELSTQGDIRSTLRDNNVKYETFLVWIDLLPDMERLVTPSPDMTFAELYARWMIERVILSSR